MIPSTQFFITYLIFLVLTLNGAKAEPSVTFLDREQAVKAIVEDESEPYFRYLQPLEIEVKTGTPIKATDPELREKEVRKRYQEACLDFTPEETQAITSYVNKLQPIFRQHYPQLGETPWQFMKLSDRIEGGLPHTRGKNIVLSNSICQKILQTSALPNEHEYHRFWLEILAHEQFHIFERAQPEFLNSLITDQWGFEKSPEPVEKGEFLLKQQVINPDAVNCDWVLPDESDPSIHLWPQLIIREGDGPKQMPRDFEMIAVALRKTDEGFEIIESADGRPKMQPLHQNLTFRKTFPMTFYCYHPREAAADLFAKIIMFDHFGNRESLTKAQVTETDRQFNPLRDWFREHFKLPDA